MKACVILLIGLAAMCVAVAAEETRILTEAEIDQQAADSVPLPDHGLVLDEHIKVGDGEEEDNEYLKRFTQAKKLMNSGNFQAAAKLFRDYVFNYGPTLFPVNRHLAHTLWLDGKLVESAYWFGRALYIAESGHNDKQLRVAYGLWAEFLTDVAHNWSSVARENLKRVVLEHEHFTALYPVHESFEEFIEADKEKIIDLADAMYEKAIDRLDYADKYHYQQWARAMGMHGRYKKAIQVARLALDAPMNPSQPAFDENVFNMLANFHKQQRKFEKCIKFGNSALALDAVEVIFVLADCYLGLHNADKALEVLTDAGEKHPYLKYEVLYYTYVAQVLAFQGEENAPIEIYRRALQLSPDQGLQGSLYVGIAKLEDSLGDYEQAHNDYVVGTELLYDAWLYNNYKPRWEVVDRPCPRRQIHHGHVTDFNIITSRTLVHGGDGSFGKKGSTPLAAPGLAAAAEWEQKQELFFEDRSVHHVSLPHSAVFAESNLNILQCGLLVGYPTNLMEANALTKLVSRIDKGVFLGPGGSFSDLSWLLLHKIPQLMLLKEAKVFGDDRIIIAPETPLVTDLFSVFGLEKKIHNFEPMVTSVFAESLDLMEFSTDEDSDRARPFEDNQFVSQWAILKARKALLPEGDLEQSQRDKIVVIKSVPKEELALTIARQTGLHDALRELGEVVVFNPFSPTLSLAKIKAAFQSAKVIVGPHSPGLAGMLFAAKGTPVVELPVQGGNHNLYANVATALDLPYWIVPTCQSPVLGEYDLSDAQIAHVVDTVRLAMAGEGGEPVPLFEPAPVHHDEL